MRADSRRFKKILPLLAIFICLAIPALAFARAGGGEGFSGGDDGGDGGGGGGGGGGAVIWMVVQWVRFCIVYPEFGLPITAGVLVVIYFTHRKGLNAYQNSVIRRGNAVSDYNQAASCSTFLTQADPAFSEADFYQRAKTAFTKLQDAWCAQNLSNVRPFISDGIFERFSIQFEDQKAFGYRDQIQQLHVSAILMAEVAADDMFDVATVRIDATAIDQRISLADGKPIGGSPQPEPFAEYWSFLRRRGVKTDPNKPGLIEGNCPNCGARIEMNQSAKCDHCGALLRSGEYDWVLAEITQESEWRPNRRTDLPGSDDLRRVDPQFNRVDLEDTAAVVFWRKTMADRLGKIDPLRKIALDDFCRQYAGNLQPGPDGSRRFFGDCAVGSVHALAVNQNAERHHAIVEIWWEGSAITVASQGRPAVGLRSRGHHIFLLERKAGSSSDPGQSVSSAHCPNCGAPTPADISSACPFCGTVLNDGSRGWVLRQFCIASSQEGQAILAQFYLEPKIPAPGNGEADPYSRQPAWATQMPTKALLAWLIKIAVADGNVDIQAEELLESLAAKSGVSVSELNSMIDMANAGTLQTPDPPNPATARAWLSAMAAIAMIDGAAHPREMDLLNAAAKKFGYTQEDVNLLLRQQRAAHLAGARQDLRDARQRAAGTVPAPHSN
jgi:predicted nucleic acid-binding Zn ribbon protein